MYYKVKDEGKPVHQIKIRDELIFDFDVHLDWEIDSIFYQAPDELQINIRRKRERQDNS